MPPGVATGAAAAAARVVAARSPERRAVVARNLRRVVGPETSEAELDRLVRRAFSSYGRYWADGAVLDLSAPEPFPRGLVVEGERHVRKAVADGRGAVVALPHLGAWEAGAVWAAREGFALTAVAEPLEPRELFDWMVEERRALGIRVVPLGPSAARELLATVRHGGLVALLADRDLVGDGVVVDFFGEPARLPAGPAVLALRSGAPILPAAIYMLPGGAHRIVVRPPLLAVREGRLRADVARVTQQLARELEALIRLAPEQWHVFQPNWLADTPG